MPKQRHLLFEVAPRGSHPGEPPSQKLAAIEVWKVKRVGKVKAASQQLLHLAIVDLLVVDERIDGAFAAAQHCGFDFIRIPTEARPPEQMSCIIVCQSGHQFTLPKARLHGRMSSALPRCGYSLVVSGAIGYDIEITPNCSCYGEPKTNFSYMHPVNISG